MKFNIPITSADLIVLAVLAVIFAGAIHVFIGFWKDPKKTATVTRLKPLLKSGSKVTLTIDGMQCGMCEIHVKDAIRKAVPEAKKLTANHTKGKATFVLSSDMRSSLLSDKLHENIDPEGYRLLSIQS